jgi:hypothetical protein
MKQKRPLFGGLPLILLFMMQCNSPNSFAGELDKVVPGASLIFKGTIVVLHTATTNEDDVSNAGVVTVKDVIEAPEALKAIAGQEVTVRFADIEKAKVGEERIFFTEPYWIGESLGVTEKGSVPKGDKLFENKDITSYIKEARAKGDEEQLRQKLKDAKLVIVGTVVKVGTPAGYKRMATEHDPEWKEAEIQIDETIKGQAEGKSINILFASSKDVMFVGSPKLKEGDAGIFITQPTDPGTAKLLRNENMVMEPSGFIRGKERVKQVKSLLQ